MLFIQHNDSSFPRCLCAGIPYSNISTSLSRSWSNALSSLREIGIVTQYCFRISLVLCTASQAQGTGNCCSLYVKCSFPENRTNMQATTYLDGSGLIWWTGGLMHLVPSLLAELSTLPTPLSMEVLDLQASQISSWVEELDLNDGQYQATTRTQNSPLLLLDPEIALAILHAYAFLGPCSGGGGTTTTVCCVDLLWSAAPTSWKLPSASVPPVCATSAQETRRCCWLVKVPRTCPHLSGSHAGQGGDHASGEQG